jgi:predicted phosphodiesterase
MRIAIVSDIHGNRTAFEAVLGDLRQTAPDMVLHGGDLADAGSSPCEIVDTIRGLGWPGVAGNTDEMLFDPPSLARFAAPLPHLKSLFDAIRDMAVAACETLGEDRIAWLRGLPRAQVHGEVALVHASPASAWRAPMDTAADAELAAVYGPAGGRVVIYGHIHRPYIRELPGMTIANSGSAGLPHDGDRRAAYLLLDDLRPTIRRVEYDVDRELRALAACGRPHAGWVSRILKSAAPEMP